MKNLLGARVRVKQEQNRIGGPKYPGREGIVVAMNSQGQNERLTLWYVLLKKTARAKERVELFTGTELDELENTIGMVFSNTLLELLRGFDYLVKRQNEEQLHVLADEVRKAIKVEPLDALIRVEQVVLREITRRSLRDVLRGYSRRGLAALEDLSNLPDVASIASEELARRKNVLFVALDECTLTQIALNQVDFPGICREVIQEQSRSD